MSPLLLTPKRTAKLLGVSVSLLYRWMSDDKTPRMPQPVNVRGVRMFSTSEIQGFVRECIAERGK